MITTYIHTGQRNVNVHFVSASTIFAYLCVQVSNPNNYKRQEFSLSSIIYELDLDQVIQVGLGCDIANNRRFLLNFPRLWTCILLTGFSESYVCCPKLLAPGLFDSKFNGSEERGCDSGFSSTRALRGRINKYLALAVINEQKVNKLVPS